jgi:hypothetical protein
MKKYTGVFLGVVLFMSVGFSGQINACSAEIVADDDVVGQQVLAFFNQFKEIIDTVNPDVSLPETNMQLTLLEKAKNELILVLGGNKYIVTDSLERYWSVNIVRLNLNKLTTNTVPFGHVNVFLLIKNQLEQVDRVIKTSRSNIADLERAITEAKAKISDILWPDVAAMNVREAEAALKEYKKYFEIAIEEGDSTVGVRGGNRSCVIS